MINIVVNLSFFDLACQIETVNEEDCGPVIAYDLMANFSH
jgi:hypothetical protein